MVGDSFDGSGDLLLLELRLEFGKGVVCQDKEGTVRTYGLNPLVGLETHLRATLLCLWCADTKNPTDYVGAHIHARTRRLSLGKYKVYNPSLYDWI